MFVYIDTRRDAEAAAPPRDRLSPTAAAVAATLAAVFGPDVEASRRALRQPLATVEPRIAMQADIGGLTCSLYADPRAVNVRTPETTAANHLRAHARRADAVVPDPNPRYAGVRYALADGPDAVPEVVDAEVLADEAAGRRSRRSLLTSAADRKVIEDRAVEVATEHFRGLGYHVVDVGAVESFDLDCRRGDERLYVEVKGTTTGGEAVIVTKGEVDLHRTVHPANALAVVRRVKLDRTATPPLATGGELVVTSPWQIDDKALTALRYRYDTGLTP